MPLDLALTADMLHPAACRATLRDLFHPFGAFCPDCATGLSLDAFVRWEIGTSVKCPCCNTEFTWRTNTPIAGKGADECQLVIIILLTRYGRPQAEIAAACDMSTRTVRRYQRLLEALPQ